MIGSEENEVVILMAGNEVISIRCDEILDFKIHGCSNSVIFISFRLFVYVCGSHAIVDPWVMKIHAGKPADKIGVPGDP